MQRILTDGTQIEVLGDKEISWQTPEIMRCGLDCPHLHVVICNGVISQGTSCSLLDKKYLFSRESLLPRRHGVELLRHIHCLQLDPEPDKFNTVWLALCKAFSNQSNLACAQSKTTSVSQI